MIGVNDWCFRTRFVLMRPYMDQGFALMSILPWEHNFVLSHNFALMRLYWAGELSGLVPCILNHDFALMNP
jgi:hypothetical protein